MNISPHPDKSSVTFGGAIPVPVPRLQLRLSARKPFKLNQFVYLFSRYLAIAVQWSVRILSSIGESDALSRLY